MDDSGNNDTIKSVTENNINELNSENFGKKRIKNSNWADMEKQMILDAMIKAKGRKQVAADILGWGRSTLWRKMKHNEIN